MARCHIAAALAGAAFSLLVFLQLASAFGLPQLDFLRLRYGGTARNSPFSQVPINPTVPGPHVLGHETLYLLGVGKADITGYANRNADMWVMLITVAGRLSRSI